MNNIFIAGIDTNAGKTIVSAIITEALKADYWKPIQAGDLQFTDTDKVRSLVSNTTTVFHPSKYAFSRPLSPHIAAEKEGITIDVASIKVPSTRNKLVIEGAGGVMTPLNNDQFILHLIKQLAIPVVLVSRNYLGSINHTLLTVAALKKHEIPVIGIIFNGDEMEGTEEIILRHSGYKHLGRIVEEDQFDKEVILKYATQFDFLNNYA